MTGLDALGPPTGNPAAQPLREALLGGQMMPGVRRRMHASVGDYEYDSPLHSVATLGGVAPALGKGLADANIALFRGLHWLGRTVGIDKPFGLEEKQVPQTLYDLLPKESAKFLASRIASANVLGAESIAGQDVGDIAEFAGGILPLLPSGGAGAGVLGKGISMAQTPGTLLRGLSFPGQMVGRKLAQIPAVAKWARSAKMLEPIIGGSTGFGLYNLFTAEGDWEDRIAAGLHGMAAGATLAVMGKVANHLEGKILDKMLSPEQIAQIGGTLRKLKSGQAPTMSELRASLGNSFAKVVGGAAENVGFVMLDEGFWDAAMSGDVAAAMGSYVKSLPAALLARTGRTDEYRFFRRENPASNNMGLRRQMLEYRRPQDAVPELLVQHREAEPGPKESGPQEPPPKQIGNTDTIYAGMTEPLGRSEPGKAYGWPEVSPGQGSTAQGAPQNPNKPTGIDPQTQRAMEAQADPLDAVSKPLFDAGWEVPDTFFEPSRVSLEFPGAGSITFVEHDPATARRASELADARNWSEAIVTQSHRESAQRFAKQQIELDIDIDQASALVGHAPEGSILHDSLRSIVDADAAYGPVTVSALELAQTIRSYSKTKGRNPNSKRVHEWLNIAAEEAHRWALVEKHGEDSLAGQVAKAASRIPLDLGHYLEVPRDVFEMVRGTEMGRSPDETVRMEGAVAEEFARDLAAITMMRRMGGELQFGGAEAWAGGPWVGKDGRHYQVGLDGQTYARDWPYKAAQSWEAVDPMPVSLTTRTDSPQLARWAQLANALRQTAKSNPGIDLVENAVILAMNGSRDSRSVQELTAFFESVSPDALAEQLTPQMLERLGMGLGRIGSGHGMAEHLAVELDAAMQAPPPTEPSERESSPIDTALEAEIDSLLESASAEGDPVQGDGRRRAKPGDPEAGSVPVPDWMVHAGRGLGSIGSGAAELGRRSYDYNFQQQAEVLRRAMPDDPLPAKGRQVNSLYRKIRGEAQHLERGADAASKKVGKSLRDMMTYSDGEWVKAKGDVGESVARWELLQDGRIKPSNKAEAVFAAAGSSVNQFLWDWARRAGVVRAPRDNPQGAKPLSEASRNVTQRMRGESADTVYGDANLRNAWFEHLINHPLNADVRITTPAGRQRKLKVSDLEAHWLEGKATGAKSGDVDAAFEHFRLLPHIPMNWRIPASVKHPQAGRMMAMRESKRQTVMANAVDSQSRRAATVQVLGQDLSPERAKAAFDYVSDRKNAVAPDIAEAVLKNVERGGPTKAVQAWSNRLQTDAGPSIRQNYKDALVKLAEQWMQTIQGRRPQGNLATRTVSDVVLPARAAMTMSAWLYDLVEGWGTLPLTYSGIGRTIRAHLNFWLGSDLKSTLTLGGPREAVRLAWRMGSVQRQMGEMMLGEGHRPVQQIANALGKVGEFVEWNKGAFLSTVADATLADWKRGNITWKDRMLLTDLNFSPKEIEALVSGKAPKGLQDQFRNEFVQLMTGRRLPGEGSAAADNPYVNAGVDFFKWASSRIDQTAGMVKELTQPRKMTKDGLLRGLRSVEYFAGMTVGGAGAMALAYLFHALMQGDPEEGLRRIVREVSDSPTRFLLRGLVTQAVAGPAARAVQGAMESSDARAISSTTVPTRYLYSLGKLLEGANAGDPWGVWAMLRAQGYIPFGGDWGKLADRASLWAATWSGEKISLMDDAISDRNLMFEFRDRGSQERGWLGMPLERKGSFPRGHDPDFYEHMEAAMEAFYQEAAQHEDAVKAAESGFQAAIKHLEDAKSVDGLRPKTIGSYIRSQMHMHGMNPADEAALLDYVGRERMLRMREHDLLVREFAQQADKIAGVQPTDVEWSDAVQRAERLAAVGMLDTDAVDAAVAHSKAWYDTTKQLVADRIRDVARVIAPSPEAVLDLFPGEKGQLLAGMSNTAERAMLIELELLSRVMLRVASDIRDEATLEMSK